MFEAKDIRSGYTEVTVIKDLDLNVEHEIFAVLGANGAGKTTLLATLARLIPLMDGEMWFDGTNITKSRPWETAALGLGYVPQEKGVFGDLGTTRAPESDHEESQMMQAHELGERIEVPTAERRSKAPIVSPSIFARLHLVPNATWRWKVASPRQRG